MVEASTIKRHVAKNVPLLGINEILTLDKDRFSREEQLAAVKVPVHQIQEFSKLVSHKCVCLIDCRRSVQFTDYVYKRPKVRTYIPVDNDRAHKLVLMEKRIVRAPTFIQYNQEKQFEVNDTYQLALNYENYGFQEVLKEVLPSGIEVPGGFEIIGNIVHLNLSDAQMPYRKIIGQVILEKSPTIKTVVAKIGQIETTFRFYALECIAGDDSSYETIHVEDKVRFQVDISRVYWCSKLSTERNRIIQDFLKEDEVLCDMFCGVGPLAVKAAVKIPKLKVLANDLNPVAFEYLEKNIKLNKLQGRVLPSNMDAREYLRMLVDKTDLKPFKQTIPSNFLKFHHCMMNLPMDAVEFLDCFVGAFVKADENIWKGKDGKFDLPMIHVYGFTNEHTQEKALSYFVERIGKAMGFSEFNAGHVTCFHNIRDVSPQSHMYSTSFRLPEEVAFATTVKQT